MRSLIFPALFSWVAIFSALAEELPILTLDALADVYYDAETGDPIVSDEIKKLNGQKVRLAGYMVPFNSLENLKEFMLMPSSSGCNFCESPMKEEIVYIRQPGKKKYEFIADPLLVTGTLWVAGAGTEPKNTTYAQFLYAFEEAKVEKLEKEHYPLLEEVTPRTIIKQVCSLLRVRLLKQVKFVALSDEAYLAKRKETVLKFLGGEAKAEQLQKFLGAFNTPSASTFTDGFSQYLAHWSSAFSDLEGEAIYYRESIDFQEPANQRQIAIASYDVLFRHEINTGHHIHKNDPNYGELAARLSLVMSLRQSFTQFYGSIGKLDLLPLTDFAKPHRATTALPEPYADLAQQILVDNNSFVEALYGSEIYQPYTKALANPPSSMDQIFTPSLYTSGQPYEAPALKGYENKFGAYLSSLILGVERSQIIVDGLNLSATGFTWEVQAKDAAAVESLLKKKTSETVKIKKNGSSLIYTGAW